ncbi:MAG: M56 family metallopeptidase [Pirellulales bacterium]|nr:M56 family metallopeptidase [Pirellulales bacterium]
MSILLRIYPGDSWAFLVANVLVQVTVIILAARLLARLGSRWNAAWRHSIYLVAIICVLASPALSWVMQTTSISLVTFPLSVPTTSPAESASTPIAQMSESNSSEMLAAPQVAAKRVPLEAESPKQGLLAGNPSLPSISDILRALGAAALVIWVLGMALLLARWCYGLHLIATLRQAARPLDSEAMAELLRQVRRALGANELPPMATSADLDRPIMVGLVRPLVILPEDVLRTLHEPDLADILVHECAHAVCRHQVVGFLQRMAGMLFWPHPLVHLLNRELARAREEVCDNYVLRRSNAPRYARTLLELSQSLVGVSPNPIAIGLFHCQWRLEDRVADLLDQRRKVMIRVNRWTVAALTTTFLLLALLIAGTKVVQAEPAANKAVPAGAKTTEKTSDTPAEEKAAMPPVKKGKSHPTTLEEAVATPLEEAVASANAELDRQFPKDHHPPILPARLTVEEVIKAIRQHDWRPKEDDKPREIFTKIAETKIIPARARLEIHKQWFDCGDSEYENEELWIDLVTKTGDTTGYGLRVRKEQLDRRIAIRPSTGYSWLVEPYWYSPPYRGNNSAGGINFSFEVDEKGALSITAFWTTESMGVMRAASDLRFVAFDENRNRYFFTERPISSGPNLALSRYRLSSIALPAEKVRYFGIEAPRKEER